MSGTSVDAIDAALVWIAPGAKPALRATHAHPIPPALKARIQTLMLPGPDELDAMGALDVELGALFAEAANTLLAQAGVEAQDIRAIGSHGQTVRHRPNGASAFTLQIGNPSVIAERTGITTVADFRARDMAAGGQGAPLVPAFHREVFGSPSRNRAIVNLGGIANLTYLPAGGDAVLGFDTGPGNTLLDQWAQRHLGKSHDEGGAWAAGGKVIAPLLERLLADPYFAAKPPKSTGREHFNLPWLEASLRKLGPAAAPQDVQATIQRLTAHSIVHALLRFLPKAEELYVCGGGAHNKGLLAVLREETGRLPVATTEALGLAPDWVEASAFAWLAHRALEGQPGNLPSVTGAKRAVILGGIYKA